LIEGFAQRSDHPLFYMRGGNARDRSSLVSPALKQRMRDLIAIAHACLIGVRRRHWIVPVFEQFAGEKGR
jgi:hypothetical protein